MAALAGDIRDTAVPTLFQDIRTGKKTGTLTLSREAEIKKVYFRAGEVIYASSNEENDQLGAALLSSGKLTREQFDTAKGIVEKTNKPFGAVVIERSFISPQDLVAGAKLQVRQIVLSLFSWQDGSYRMENDNLPLSEIVPLQMNTGALLFEGMRNLDWKTVRRSLPPLKTVLRTAQDMAAKVQGIELDQDHHTILSFIDGNRNIMDVCALSEMGDYGTLKVLHALIALQAVEAVGTKATSEPGRRPAAAAPEEPAPPEAEEIVVTREMIQQAYDSLNSRDYYQMLDIGRNASPMEIKKSYFRLAKVYHPDRHAHTEFSDMLPMLEALFVNINEAYTVLSDTSKRDQYNVELTRGTKKYRSGEPTPSQQSTKKASAALQFKEGMKQYRAQNFWGAEEAFRWAVLLDPSNPDYVFHQGLALARIPRRGHDAEERFLKAIDMDPAKIDYHLELGTFYEKKGLKTKALTLYQSALKRFPNSEKIKQAMEGIGK